MAVVDVFQSQTWAHFRHLFCNASTCISSVIQCFQGVEGTFSVQKQLRVKECRVIMDIYKMAWALELKQKWTAAQSIWSRNDPSLSQTVCRMHASTKTVEQIVHSSYTLAQLLVLSIATSLRVGYRSQSHSHSFLLQSFSH